ncbi:MAG: hypothetical protein ACRD4S_06180 [Candidatus Acidiferrales bacterium]
MPMVDSTLFVLLVAWGIVTAVLICLLIYRSTIESHEDDQMFLDSSGNSMASEQRAIVARLSRLSRPITLLIVASSSLLVISAAIWLWQGFRSF